LFTREAVVLIQEYSHGIPRTISVICDNALLNGFAAGRQPVGRDIVEEVGRDFDLHKTAAPVIPHTEVVSAPALGVERPDTAERPVAELPVAAPVVVAPTAPSAALPADEPERPMFSDAAKSRRFSLFGRS
jgi:hypothetical protein